jgi:predicted DCC family thiol-disulfide oxidoreductase YuxK
MKKLIVVYDNWCPKCNKFIGIINKLDWFKLIICKQLRNDKDLLIQNNIDLKLANEQMASFTNRWNYGYISIFYISLRLPLFWLFIPVLYAFKISGLGQYIYLELAIRRKVIPLNCDEISCKKTTL